MTVPEWNALNSGSAAQLVATSHHQSTNNFNMLFRARAVYKSSKLTKEGTVETRQAAIILTCTQKMAGKHRRFIRA